jgi:hypothetical protein
MGRKAQRLEAAIHDTFIHATAHADQWTGLEVIEYMLRELKDYDVIPKETLLSMIYEYQDAMPVGDEVARACACEYESEDRV